MKAIIAGAAAAILGVGALGVKSAMDLDYKSLDEEGQQDFLDGIAKGFEGGFAASARGQAEITYIVASAANDTIAADIKFINPQAEQINGAATELMKKQLFAEYCNYFGGAKLNDSGVTFKMRLMRPSGAPVATVSFNEETCAPHVKTASTG